MFRLKSPSPAAYVERRLTPRRGDGGTAAPAPEKLAPWAPRRAGRIHTISQQVQRQTVFFEAPSWIGRARSASFGPVAIG